MVLQAIQSLGTGEQVYHPQLDLRRAPPRGQQELHQQQLVTEAHICNMFQTMSQIHLSFCQVNEGILQNFDLSSQVKTG